MSNHARATVFKSTLNRIRIGTRTLVVGLLITAFQVSCGSNNDPNSGSDSDSPRCLRRTGEPLRHFLEFPTRPPDT